MTDKEFWCWMEAALNFYIVWIDLPYQHSSELALKFKAMKEAYEETSEM